MRRTDAIVIGGGQAGLAMSRSLSDLAIDHVVLERGRVAERWRTERWDSLRLLTPNWQTRLPGYRYHGADPNGFMTVAELIGYLEQYADASSAPIEGDTEVRSVRRDGDEYVVETSRGTWRAGNVIVATGHNDKPWIPEIGRELAPDIHQAVPSRYRNPDSLPDGGVLVVGASATGIQLADEIHRSGRPVTLAVGRHTRLPRLYRGVDIMWWLDASGALDRRPSPTTDTNQPSLQLIGTPERRSIDLGQLQRDGVRLVGRAGVADGATVGFRDDLEANIAEADEKMHRVLARIDEFIEAHPLGGDVPAPYRPDRIRPTAPPATINMRAEGIRTVLWATGFRRQYPWLQVPVFDRSGEIENRGGITPLPGLYVIGLQYMRRMKSSFIDGVGDDARVLAYHVSSRLHGALPAAA